MNSTGNFLTAETASGLMDVYVSSPIAEQKLPVVIVLQEAFGVNHHIRSICDRLASQGFFAAAPDLFHREGRRIEVPYTDRRSFMPLLGNLKNSEIIEDVRDTLKFLEDLPTPDLSNVSTMGFCVGGFASALVATELNLKKMISFYGGGMVHRRDGIGLEPIVEKLGKIRSPCLFFFGGKDASISHDDIGTIEKKLSSSGVPFEVDIFETSDHGFFCDERKTYNQVDASIAWKKSIRFLQE